MKNLNMKVWQVIICWILIIFFTCSCGTRKSELIKEKEVLKSKIDYLSSEITKLKEKKVVKKNKVIKKNIVTKEQELKLTPKDYTKPIKVTDWEGKETSYLNAIVDVKTKDKLDKTESTKSEEKTTEKEAETAKNTNLQKSVESEKELKNKKTESKKSWLNYLPFGIFFLLLLLCFFFRKKIPIIKNLFK